MHLTVKLTKEESLLFEAGKEYNGIRSNTDYLRHLISKEGNRVLQLKKGQNT